ncbi:MAG: hypothetical protein A3H57_01495 [Candidatus Taylorbacteria bacterium RIFCSPLOWO2_02_FULL_43_11]|uniref:Uncharacterized protein n=1 Tax=Candidatus Taylorbacteria bacterium RIFCSPHIGHO2_02_FULL_43_32b TaxID=1802306 RepID=A0A1G2MM21_9BACT|nr:MAG: hypothetical protein A2743_00965 [Candidatus Taylorbacteria bacterium RIFCSPHIGHO2_01_FULL_43_47]OHA24269.1 MAG: hypothetical protein A3C72_04380 [Candidatus Taylorbacteria bacterium RIFCSPHIGHO2_02_FULL_43_32b]OHA31386.1 MAG: hypothetical protein A3B08_00600 [Candidatus Taylorbacteria bacterium RIFCSPLOWO2_01_FULL_43_44]OHA36582.1 MAG: hypothetical protein A3H57_01495 [Candidatus Taylorbacteria bacterium RIFCSPLOWO2_02_FULL_43_11]
MNWKTWPYWVRGSSVGTIVSLLLGLWIVLFCSLCYESWGGLVFTGSEMAFCQFLNPQIKIFTTILFFEALPVQDVLVRMFEGYINNLSSQGGYLFNVALAVVALIFNSIVLGALIGLVYGKIKSCRSNLAPRA